MNVRSFVTFSCLLLAACANPDQDWQLASRDDSQNAYLEFLAMHPDSEFADQARQRIEELKVVRAWERAEFKDNLESYTGFVEKFPDSEFVAEARERITEMQRDDYWESIDASDDKAALESFLMQYPDTPQAAEAREQLDAIIATEIAARPKEREGNFRLQLAAFRTVAAAEQELRRLVELAPETLIGPVRIEAPEQNGNGGMFILKSVPMTGVEARDACAALKRMGQECLVINR